MIRIWQKNGKRHQVKPAGEHITKVQPDSLVIAGYSLAELIENATLIEAAHLLVTGQLPPLRTLRYLNRTAISAAGGDLPDVRWKPGEDISKYTARCLLSDDDIASFTRTARHSPVDKTVFTLGRVVGYIAKAFSKRALTAKESKNRKSFDSVLFHAFRGPGRINRAQARMLEAIITACVDHGVTPPSAQATIIAATVRPAFEVAIAQGVGVITDVHGGAGAKAAEFFLKCAALQKKKGYDKRQALHFMIIEYMRSGKVIEGLGHRIHKKDPRVRSLWRLAEKYSLAGECVAISHMAADEFEKVRGMSIPINVDGVVGSIVADMGLAADAAKALFICGRIVGLAAHYFEETGLYPPMRKIDFEQAFYKGERLRKVPHNRK
ncbi:citrate/2-methylcitrate synthase [Elusimicrobiota bacterium]